MEHVLVIASNCCPGAHFVRRALELGHRVTGVSRSPEVDPVFRPYQDLANQDNFSFLRFDLNEDLEPLMRHMDAERPAFVVNFAALSMVNESWQHPEQWLRTNTIAPTLLYDQLRRRTWLRKYVQISSPEVYGPTAEPVAENGRYNPGTPYSVSKAAADLSLAAFIRAYDFPAVFTRSANIYGPGQRLYRLIPRAILKFLTGGVLELQGGGLAVKPFIHARDVAEATYLAMINGEPGEIFHIAPQGGVAMKDLVSMVADRMGIDPGRHVKTAGDRLIQDSIYLLDSSWTRRRLNWADRIDLSAGLDETINWVTANLSTLLKQPQDYQHTP